MKVSVEKLMSAGLVAGWLAGTAWGGVDTSFLQLNRAAAQRSQEEWNGLFQRMKEAGIDRVFVQWCAEPPVAYYAMDEGELDEHPYFEESCPAVQAVLDAALTSETAVYLGLQNNPHYWTQINAREKVLRDFLLLRVARNEALQKILLERFHEHPAWLGYYIPDEIDDLTWRQSPRKDLIRHYVALMCERIRFNDPYRPVAMSAFFRGRTSPERVAANLADIFAGSGLDMLLIQDGVGVGDPPLSYVSLYYKVLSDYWPKRSADLVEAAALAAEEEADDPPATRRGPSASTADTTPVNPGLPSLWGVVEAFEQTSGSDEPFQAEPASPSRLRRQISEARPFFQRLVLFTFPDYADPAAGEASRALFDVLSQPDDQP